MSTTDILQPGGADAQSTDERARAAVKTFHRMQPSLSAYARALTGRPDVRVVVSPTSNGHTDGKKIFFRPPLALGDNTPHERKLCDRRDHETLLQLCPACSIREEVLITIYHEIAHIAFGSFEDISEGDRVKALEYGISLSAKKYAEAIRERIRMAPESTKSTYIGLAGLVSPYLPGIVNGLEDARVNAQAARARKGTRVMFQASTMRVLLDGFEANKGNGVIEKVYWRDQPLNAQMICALYAKAAGYEIRGVFVPEVDAALDDRKVMDILRDFPTVRNAKGVYALSVAMLIRLRELGFYKHPTDPPADEEEDQTEPEQDEQEQEDDGSEGEGSDTGASSSSESGPGDDDGPPSEAEPPEDADGSGSSPGEEESETGPTQSDDSGDTEPEDSDAGDDGGDTSEEQQSDSDDAGESSSESGGESSDRNEQAAGSEHRDDASSDDSAGSDSESGEGGSEDDASTDETSDQSEGGEVDEGQGDSVGSDEAVEDAATDVGSESSGDEDASSDDSEGRGHDHGSSTGEPSDDSDQEASPDSDGELGEPSDADGDADSGEDPSDGELDEQAGGTGDSAGSGRPEGTDDLAERDLPERDDSTSEHEEGLDEDEVIDTGADEGYGGVEVVEDSAFDRLPMGTPEEVNDLTHDIAHPEDRPDRVYEEEAAGQEMDRAIMQGLYFETPSRDIFGVREHYWNQPIEVDGHNMSQAWDQSGYSIWGYSRKQLGQEGDFHCPETILGPALLRMRVAFADNKRGTDLRSRKSGKVDAKMIGKRVHFDDERFFKKRIIPGKKDYFVLIGIDISGSTVGVNIVLAKRAAMAQAELCHRMGIKFAVFAHSGNYHAPNQGRGGGLDMDVYHIKDPDEPWTTHIQERLIALGPDSVNLDGHTFEYYRKMLDRRSETHRVMLYYTDGKMPAENYEEELEILQREITICRQRKYVLIGVGIRTDSPTQHGLDTVQVNGDEDIIKVVKHLEKRLLEI